MPTRGRSRVDISGAKQVREAITILGELPEHIAEVFVEEGLAEAAKGTLAAVRRRPRFNTRTAAARERATVAGKPLISTLRIRRSSARLPTAVVIGGAGAHQGHLIEYGTKERTTRRGARRGKIEARAPLRGAVYGPRNRRRIRRDATVGIAAAVRKGSRGLSVSIQNRINRAKQRERSTR